MPRYMVTRSLPPLGKDDLVVVQKNVIDAAKKIDGVSWIRSHLTADGRNSFCELEAPSADACREHARIAQLPVDDVIPLGMEIGPTTRW